MTYEEIKCKRGMVKTEPYRKKYGRGLTVLMYCFKAVKTRDPNRKMYKSIKRPMGVF